MLASLVRRFLNTEREIDAHLHAGGALKVPVRS